MNPPRLAILASGQGSTLKSIVDAQLSGALQASIAGVLSNRPGIGALSVARNFDIPTMVLDPKAFHNRTEWNEAVLETLKKWQVDWVILAGFLTLLGAPVLRAFPNRIVNTHPSLLPKFGGPGMYGRRVHEAVLASGDRETGFSVHLVNEQYDEGRILIQMKVGIQPSDRVEDIEARVRSLEQRHFPKIINDLVTARMKVN
ncbi:MAG: phosphoribosylglycinamide formyltransferase [Bdellovibrionales bacterium]